VVAVVIEVSPSCVGGPTLEGAMHNARDESKGLMTYRMLFGEVFAVDVTI
jgi:hypothetical protein